MGAGDTGGHQPYAYIHCPISAPRAPLELSTIEHQLRNLTQRTLSDGDKCYHHVPLWGTYVFLWVCELSSSYPKVSVDKLGTGMCRGHQRSCVGWACTALWISHRESHYVLECVYTVRDITLSRKHRILLNWVLYYHIHMYSMHCILYVCMYVWYVYYGELCNR